MKLYIPKYNQLLTHCLDVDLKHVYLNIEVD